MVKIIQIINLLFNYSNDFGYIARAAWTGHTCSKRCVIFRIIILGYTIFQLQERQVG